MQRIKYLILTILMVLVASSCQDKSTSQVNTRKGGNSITSEVTTKPNTTKPKTQSTTTTITTSTTTTITTRTTTTIATHTHTLTHHSRVEGDCLNKGTIEYCDCACGKKFSDENGINEITSIEGEYGNHHLSSLIAKSPASCTTAGTMAHKECTICGEYFNEDDKVLESIIIPALGHISTDGEVTVEATCSTPGTKTYICPRCGDTVNESYYKEHTYVSNKLVKEGCLIYSADVCSICGDAKNKVLFDESHMNTSVVDEVNGCTIIHKTVCDDCGKVLGSYNEEDHTFVYKSHSTELKEGYQSYYAMSNQESMYFVYECSKCHTEVYYEALLTDVTSFNHADTNKTIKVQKHKGGDPYYEYQSLYIRVDHDFNSNNECVYCHCKRHEIFTDLTLLVGVYDDEVKYSYTTGDDCYRYDTHYTYGEKYRKEEYVFHRVSTNSNFSIYVEVDKTTSKVVSLYYNYNETIVFVKIDSYTTDTYE